MEDLIQQAKNGDKLAFVELMEAYKSDMYKTAKGILRNDEDVADAMQDMILSAYKNIHTLKEAKYCKTWLTRILINKCRDILKQNKKYVTGNDCLQNAISTISHETPHYQENFESELFENLSEKYRTVLILYYQNGFSIKEISEILKISENTVKSRLKRARDKIQFLSTSERRSFS